MKKATMLLAVSIVTLSATIIGCKKSDDSTTTSTSTSKSLYDRLGGKAVDQSTGLQMGVKNISAVVDQFLANVLADAKINGRFSKANAGALRNNLIDQICQASGGPCSYKGLSMKAAHSTATGKEYASGRVYNVSMITADEFSTLVADLTAAMNKIGVDAQEQSDLLAVLGPMKSDITGNQ